MNDTGTVRPSWYRGQHRAAAPWQQIWGTVAFITLIVLCLTAIGVVLARPARAAQLSPPIERLAAYYHWYPENWGTGNAYTSAYGQFSSDNQAIMAADMADFKDKGLTGVYASWWGVGAKGEQTRLPKLLAVAAAAGMHVTAYYEPEGQSPRPSLDGLRTHLAYLHAYADRYPSWLRRDGRPVLMVYNATAESSTCAETQRWADATAGTDWLIILKVFDGYRGCLPQPLAWHQYSPDHRYVAHTGVAGVSEGASEVSAGFDKYNEPPRLVRDDQAWCEALTRQVLGGLPWQLSYGNEFREGTQIVPTVERMSPSGWGTDLDIMRQVYVEGRRCLPGSPSPTISPTTSPSSTPTTSPSPSPTTTPGPTASPTASPSPSTSPSPSPTVSPSPPPSGDTTTVMAVGDIVEQPPCNGYTSGCQDGFTAELIGKYSPTAVLSLGDNQYESNTLAEYQAGWGRTTCAAPSDCDAWGKHLGVMYPAPGNHEWLTTLAQGYRDYFGPRLTIIGSDTPSPSRMYYSYDLGAWHFISLDSDCSQVGGCSPSSPQGQWLAADLAANNGRPTILYFHHPRWSSGNHGNITSSDPFWRAAVADLDVQLVLNGHDHWLEGFEPLGVDGLPAANGVREFVVGTGGKGFTYGTAIRPGSQAHQYTSMGVLHLTLGASNYSWSFKSVAEVGGPGPAFAYSGSSGLRLPPALAGVVAQTSTALSSLGISIDTAARSVPLLLRGKGRL